MEIFLQRGVILRYQVIRHGKSYIPGLSQAMGGQVINGILLKSAAIKSNNGYSQNQRDKGAGGNKIGT